MPPRCRPCSRVAGILNLSGRDGAGLLEPARRRSNGRGLREAGIRRTPAPATPKTAPAGRPERRRDRESGRPAARPPRSTCSRPDPVPRARRPRRLARPADAPHAAVVVAHASVLTEGLIWSTRPLVFPARVLRREGRHGRPTPTVACSACAPPIAHPGGLSGVRAGWAGARRGPSKRSGFDQHVLTGPMAFKAPLVDAVPFYEGLTLEADQRPGRPLARDRVRPRSSRRAERPRMPSAAARWSACPRRPPILFSPSQSGLRSRPPIARSGPRPRSSSRRRCTSRSRRAARRDFSPQDAQRPSGRARRPRSPSPPERGRARAGRAAVRTRRPAGHRLPRARARARRRERPARSDRRDRADPRSARDRGARAAQRDRRRRGGARMTARGHREHGYYEAWWIQIIKALVIFGVVLGILPLVIVYERKLLGRFQGRYGPNRVGPFGLLQPLAEILKFATKEDVPPGHVGRAAVLRGAGDLDHLRGRGVRARALRRRPAHLRHPRRPLRRRHLGRAAVRVRLRRDRLLRADARRLGVGLEVLLPRGDARRRPADLLRGRAGPRAVRRDHHRRQSVADGDRPRAGRHVVLHPAVRRLHRVHDRELRRNQPLALRRRRGGLPRSSPATSPNTAARAWSRSCSPSTST